jgi:hypothetical protein
MLLPTQPERAVDKSCESEFSEKAAPIGTQFGLPPKCRLNSQNHVLILLARVLMGSRLTSLQTASPISEDVGSSSFEEVLSYFKSDGRSGEFPKISHFGCYVELLPDNH